MLRSTEILISLGTEAVWWQQPPGTLSLLGSLLVTACVLSMGVHDRIVDVAARAAGWIKWTGKNEEARKLIKTGL